MSYDLQLWTSVSVAREALPDAPSWEVQADTWVWRGKGWQIVVHPNQAVEPDDVPDQVMPLLPGIARLTALHLEPGSAPQKAHSLLARAAKALCRPGGVLVDPQTDEVSTASGGRKYLAPADREDTFSILLLSWWFTESPLQERPGVGALLDLMSRLLPEALPRRYGLYEPPQYKYEDQGHDHFVQLIEAERGGMVVWYPKRPVRGVDFQCDRNWGEHRLGFRSNHFAISIEADALADPGWHLAIRRFWRAASELIRPFYGDVRTMSGYSGRGSTLWTRRETQRHPIKSWWWKGIPSCLGHAVVLGSPYIGLWPAFSTVAEQAAGLAFLTADQWTPATDVTARVGGVPQEMMQPQFAPVSGTWEEVERANELERRTYPIVFPFGTAHARGQL